MKRDVMLRMETIKARIRLLTLVLLLVGAATAARADRGDPIKREYYLHNFDDASLPLEKRILYADSLASLGGGEVPMRVLNMKAKMLSDLGRDAEALEALRIMWDRIPADSLERRYDAMVKMGIVENNRRNYCGAVDMAYRLLHEPKPDSLQYFDIYAYWIIIDFYMTAEQWNSAWKYQKAGLEKLKTLSAKSLFPKEEVAYAESVFHRTAADIYLKTDHPDEAYSEIRKSTELVKAENLDWHTYTTFAEIASKKKEYHLAEHYYREALRAPYIYNYPVVGWIRMLLEKGEVGRADSLMRVYKEDLQLLKGTPLEREHLENMVAYYRLTGDYREESRTLERIIEFSDSLNKASLLIGSGTVTNRYEYEEVTGTIARLQGERRRNGVWAISLGAGLALTVGAAVGLWLRLRRRKRELGTLQAEIGEMETRQKEASLQAEESIETQNRELSTMAMYLARLNDAVANIRDNADAQGEDAGRRLREIRKIVDELQMQNNAWEMFSTYFNRVHKSFFKKLDRRHPTLTKAESRMCAFIMMGMTTKEIAVFTHRSPRTVESIKYNIRKKLGCEESTESYLRKL